MRNAVKLICAAACAAIAMVARPVEASGYPDRPIKLIVPTVPGTVPDVLSRLIGDRLATVLGQPLVIENRPGAIGTIGLNAVAKALPNGYTLGVLTVPYIIAPRLLAQVPYDTERDLAPVTLVAWNYTLLAVPIASPVRSVADLVNLAKVKPGELKFSSPGNATPPHLAGELFERAAGIDLVHIPYKGASASTTALATGEVDMGFASPGVIAQYVKAGKLRTLATAAPRRLAAYPDLPTLRELGYAVEISDWQGIVVPAGTPKDVIATLHAAITKVIAAEDFKQRLDTLGMEVGGIGPAEYAAHIHNEIQRWGKLVRDAGIKAD
jgi:tripartite-type tricarboxylate transporter receptor subunit TctC